MKPKPIDYDDLEPKQIESEMRRIARQRDAAAQALEVARQRVQSYEEELGRAGKALARKTTVQ